MPDLQLTSRPRPLIIPVFLPHAGCPHCCAFCNQRAVTGAGGSRPDPVSVRAAADHYLQFRKNRVKAELAFFGGNFLGLPEARIISLLDSAMPLVKQKKIDGIRFSTRPDTVTAAAVELIRTYPVSVVEIGAQSMDNGVLDASLRGHTAQDTRSAVGLLKQAGIDVGLQMMIGMREDTPEKAVSSARAMADLHPVCVRVYPLLVLESSLMARWYRQGNYTPLTLEQSVDLAADIADIFSSRGIPVIRMGLQSSDIISDSQRAGSQVIAGPWHPAFGHLVHARRMFKRACVLIDHYISDIASGEADQAPRAPVSLMVHPRALSRLRGDKNSNVRMLEARYPGIDFSMATDSSMGLDDVGIRRS